MKAYKYLHALILCLTLMFLHPHPLQHARLKLFWSHSSSLSSCQTLFPCCEYTNTSDFIIAKY